MRTPDKGNRRNAALLAPDDVVDLELLGLARKLDPYIGQHRHEVLPECVELLARVPDLADSEMTARFERDVVVKPGRRPFAGTLKTADGLIVLFGGHASRAREAHKNARRAIARARGR